jgi:hypothetical protein
MYFLIKLWETFYLGIHFNYFDIGEFRGVGSGSMDDRENARHDSFLGPHPTRRRPNTLVQHPPIAENIIQT